jgi:hypothetical protein
MAEDGGTKFEDSKRKEGTENDKTKAEQGEVFEGVEVVRLRSEDDPL